jgi:hypothetical protein
LSPPYSLRLKQAAQKLRVLLQARQSSTLRRLDFDGEFEMPTAAGQIWPNLPHDDERVAKQSRRTVADAMWPSLSKEAKAKEASQTWAQAWARKEQRASNARTAEHLRQINERLAQERGR